MWTLRALGGYLLYGLAIAQQSADQMVVVSGMEDSVQNFLQRSDSDDSHGMIDDNGRACRSRVTARREVRHVRAVRRGISTHNHPIDGDKYVNVSTPTT